MVERRRKKIWITSIGSLKCCADVDGENRKNQSPFDFIFSLSISRLWDFKLLCVGAFSDKFWHNFTLTFWKHFLNRVAQIFEIDFDWITWREIVERFIRLVPQLNWVQCTFDNVSLDVSINQVSFISLRDGNWRKRGDCVHIGFLID